MLLDPGRLEHPLMASVPLASSASGEGATWEDHRHEQRRVGAGR
jgi:hypothetical protein